MSNAKIYADFHNADAQGRIRLNCVGTVEDLSQQKVELREGLVVILYADDLDERGELDELLVDGVVSFSEGEHCLVIGIELRTTFGIEFRTTDTCSGRYCPIRLATLLRSVSAARRFCVASLTESDTLIRDVYE